MTIYYIWNYDNSETVREWFLAEADSKDDAIRKTIKMQHRLCGSEDWHDDDNYIAYTYEEMKKEFGCGEVVRFEL